MMTTKMNKSLLAIAIVLTVATSVQATQHRTFAADTVPVRKPQIATLFSSLPFVPRPEFKPEIRNVQQQRPSSAVNTWDPPALINDSNTLDLFEEKPNPYRKEFVTVHLPMPDPRLGPNNGPTVIPIVFGNLTMHDDHFKFSSTVMLILDERKEGKCHILVDTGLAMFKNTILGGLAAHGLRPSDIHYLVLTHGDVDNTGNLNLFLDAHIFSANRKIIRQAFYAQREAPTFEEGKTQLPSRKLCENTDIYLTPGYSPTDLSLIVRNVQNFGTVAIVGNLIMNQEDSVNSRLWEQFSYDDEMRRLWEATRNEIFCLADYIVPGHGKMFKVDPDMKKNAGCQDRESMLVR